jgi:hypothetical protein
MGALLTDFRRSCKASNNAELKNEKRGDPSMILKYRPGYSA